MDGNEIQQLREDLGVTRQELARRLQVSVSTVDRWESGLSTPAGEVVHRIQRIRRLKDFQKSGRLMTLGDVLRGEPPEDERNHLPPWHPDSDGVDAGQLSLIVSPPRCGKTLTALRWAYRSCQRHRVPAYYVSTHWTPGQTLRHLEKGLDEGATLDPDDPFYIFQHDGKNVTSMLEELSLSMEERRSGLAPVSIVVVDWLQNLDYAGERFLRMEEKERQILRDLKTWSTQQRAFVLVIASQRGIPLCEEATFPHFFELADSISVGQLERLKVRDVTYTFQDLHRGGKEIFRFQLPAAEELVPESVPPTVGREAPASPRSVGPARSRRAFGSRRNEN